MLFNEASSTDSDSYILITRVLARLEKYAIHYSKYWMLAFMLNGNLSGVKSRVSACRSVLCLLILID